MNHTETPWVLCQQDGAKLAYTIFTSSQLKAGRIEVAEWDSYVALAGGLNSGNAEANARRIVACVNACEGISTENLEDNKPIIELANDYNAVLKQRDMLLDVLKQIAKVETHGGDISASWTLISVKHLAQGVVEKVKGGAV